MHIAAFHHPEHGACEAYVKLFRENTGKEISNEVTAYLCAHALSVPQPQYAFVANIPLARLRNPPRWIAAIAKTQAVLPGFCTTRLDGESAAVIVPGSKIQLIIDEVSKWENIEQAIALDENIAQTDRHLNNLIRLSRKKFALIDGGRLAAGENGECWSVTSLQSLQLYRNRLSECIWSHRPQQKSIAKMLVLAQYHVASINVVHNELQYWWSQLLEPIDAKAFNDFLVERSAHIELLLRQRYRMLEWVQ